MASGETTPLAMANESLAVLNDMIDGWNAERQAIFTTRIDDFPFVLNQQSYTLGTGGNFNIPRPARIDAMSAILLNNPANPVEVPMYLCTTEYWQTQVPVKTVQGSFPTICYDSGEFPLRTLQFWPIPTDQNSVRIYSWQALTQPATLDSVIAFPPGYAEAFRYNLAVRLAAEFASPLTPTVATLAITFLARIKTMNAPDLELRSDLVPDPAGWNYKAEMFGLPY
jgi:hypothetical protein